MIRVLLAVVLSVALLGVAMPVVEDARAERTSSSAEGELTRLSDRAVELATTEEAGPGGVPRRVIAVSLPEAGMAATPIDYVAIGGVPDCGMARDTDHGDVVAYRLQGGDVHARYVSVDLRIVTDGRVRDDGDPLILRGDARVSLSLVDDGADPTVLVRRDTGDSTTPVRRTEGDRRA